MSASCASLIIERRSNPKCIRNKPRAAVAQRVCSTDFSSAKGITIECVAYSVTGEPWTEVNITEGIFVFSNIFTTSVVVPEREIETILSYLRS